MSRWRPTEVSSDKRVILGGHSAGASTAVAYAAWDFGGRPGFRDFDGLVLIDGGLLGSFRSADLARVRRDLAASRGGDVFLDILGLGLPEATACSPRRRRCGRSNTPTSRRWSSSTHSA